MLVFVRSLHQASFAAYLDALTELAPWFFALDHTDYARWIPVHLRDMAELSTKHPEIAAAFHEVGLLLTRLTEYFRVFLLTRHMNRIMPSLREMEELLVSLTIQVLFGAGW